MTTSKKNINQKETKMLLIVIANTVIDPWTVVIHMSNTSFASRAMMRMRRLDWIALLALFGHDFIQVSNISCIDNNRAFLLRLFSQWHPFFFDCTPRADSLHHGFKRFLIFIFYQWFFLIRKFYSTISTLSYKNRRVSNIFDSFQMFTYNSLRYLWMHSPFEIQIHPLTHSE